VSTSAQAAEPAVLPLVLITGFFERGHFEGVGPTVVHRRIMVISSQGSDSSAEGATFSLKPLRQSLKQQSGTSARKRRGLSAFYSSKSQSFNCIRDLQANPFCQSALVLAKPQPSSWKQPFGSIQEDMCELHTPQQQLECMPTRAVSEPGSPQAQHDLVRHSWPGGQANESFDSMAPAWLSSHLPALSGCEQLHQPEGLSGLGMASSFHVGSISFLQGSRSASLGPSLSSSDSDVSSMDASETSADVTGGACCFAEPQQSTDSLCDALRAASLAVPRHSVQLPMAAFGSL
jgi:hypothetical protein